MNAQQAWDSYAPAQKREVMTACVIVALSPTIKSTLPSVASAIKSLIQQEIRVLEQNQTPSDDQKKCLKLLREIAALPETFSGLENLELIMERTEIITFLPIVKKIWDILPKFFKFLGFGSLLKNKAIFKFCSFAMHWKYSGKGYEPPKGMSEPFSGFDDIIHSLMDHPACVAEMKKQTRAWEQAQKN